MGMGMGKGMVSVRVRVRAGVRVSVRVRFRGWIWVMGKGKGRKGAASMHPMQHAKLWNMAVGLSAARKFYFCRTGWAFFYIYGE